ncbi:hypothetical protein BB987_17515 [Photorhabdus temperata]|uniref:Uncharacterized protein n=2 Tax=Photorhabdus khanii TaxID=1004150 RepID=W3V3L4_9GAMM|nr:hypothetical protein [Photorhabdus khanii]ETS29634.1 hypothetical protein PTE_04060 [Photorhabdus khanii NC19]MQL48946.1 hypothetical protein [Photorhabdus khanii]OHV51175.1 hypothetical protein BB987_17515 [Photorhabdus temperata]
MKKLNNIALTEYDLRQLNLMKETLGAYVENRLPLNVLIDRLRDLLDCLQDVNNEWKEQFYEHWFSLEQVYAVALDRNEPLSQYESYINDSVKGLNNLLGW